MIFRKKEVRSYLQLPFHDINGHEIGIAITHQQNERAIGTDHIPAKSF